MVHQYDKIKQKNNQTDAARTDWKWYEQLDEILGTRETTSPSFISDGLTANIESMTQKEQGIEPKSKKSKTSTGSISDAILTMSLVRERMWEKKYEIQEKELEFKNWSKDNSFISWLEEIFFESLRSDSRCEIYNSNVVGSSLLKSIVALFSFFNNFLACL